MAITAQDLIDIARSDYLNDESDAVDGGDTYLRWSDAFLLRQVVDAQKQACYRQDLRHIFDGDTEAITQITVEAGTQSYDLDSRILRIERALLDDTEHELLFVSQNWLESTGFDWRNTARAPTRFFVTGRILTFDTEPVTDATLYLKVWREPLADPDVDDDLEFPYDQEKLVYWVCYKAFLLADEDTMNMDMALYYRDMFDQNFGPEVPARVRSDILTYPGPLQFGPSDRFPGNTNNCLTTSFDIASW